MPMAKSSLVHRDSHLSGVGFSIGVDKRCTSIVSMIDQIVNPKHEVIELLRVFTMLLVSASMSR